MKFVFVWLPFTLLVLHLVLIGFLHHVSFFSVIGILGALVSLKAGTDMV